MWHLIIFLTISIFLGIGFLRLLFGIMRDENKGKIPSQKPGQASTELVAFLVGLHFFVIFPAMAIWAHLGD